MKQSINCRNYQYDCGDTTRKIWTLKFCFAGMLFRCLHGLKGNDHSSQRIAEFQEIHIKIRLGEVARLMEGMDPDGPPKSKGCFLESISRENREPNHGTEVIIGGEIMDSPMCKVNALYNL